MMDRADYLDVAFDLALFVAGITLLSMATGIILRAYWQLFNLMIV